MVEPDHADVHERHRVGEIRRPVFEKRVGQCPGGYNWTMDFEHKERDDNCERCVTKRFHPPRANKSLAAPFGWVTLGICRRFKIQ
jgi:hypothetical protein